MKPGWIGGQAGLRRKAIGRKYKPRWETYGPPYVVGLLSHKPWPV